MLFWHFVPAGFKKVDSKCYLLNKGAMGPNFGGTKEPSIDGTVGFAKQLAWVGGKGPLNGANDWSFSADLAFLDFLFFFVLIFVATCFDGGSNV